MKSTREAELAALVVGVSNTPGDDGVTAAAADGVCAIGVRMCGVGLAIVDGVSLGARFAGVSAAAAEGSSLGILLSLSLSVLATVLRPSIVHAASGKPSNI